MNYSLCIVLFVTAFALTTGNVDENPDYKITTKRENDRVVVRGEKDSVVFSIHSPFGISCAVIERTAEKWPDAVVLQLHLKGLEHFSVTNEKEKLEASVSSHDGQVRLWKDGEEDTPLDDTSPYWMDIRMIGSDGQPTNVIPLKDGYFDLPLPKAFFEGNPKSITLTWIDFYRN